MEKDITSLKIEASEILAQIKAWSDSLSKLMPVSYESKVKWFGGIPGAIIEYRETQRMVKLLNTIIIDDYSYGDFAYVLMAKIKELGKATREYQSQLPEDSEESIQFGDDVIITIPTAVKNWKNYSPSLAMVVIEDDEVNKNKKKKERLSLSAQMYIASIEGVSGIHASPEAISIVKKEIPLAAL